MAEVARVQTEGEMPQGVCVLPEEGSRQGVSSSKQGLFQGCLDGWCMGHRLRALAFQLVLT